MSNQLRILVVSHGHPSLSAGGGENVAYGLFNEFQQRSNCEALFLAVHRQNHPPHLGSYFATYNADNYEVLFYTGQSDSFLFSVSETSKVCQSFRMLLEQFKPSIVHFHHYIMLGLELIREVHNYSPDVPIVLTLHEYLAICYHNGQMVKTEGKKLCYQSNPADCHQCFPNKSPADFKMRELYIKSFLKLVDSFIAPSYFLRNRYIQWGLPGDKLQFIENGQAPIEPAPPRQLKSEESRNRFAYFGQINPYKGLDILLEALTYLPANSNLTVDIYGANLEQWPEDYQVNFNKNLHEAKQFARFHGPYRREELPRLMAEIDWVIVPSIWWENSPLVIQEAFSHRRPVICSDIGGMAEKVKPYQSGLHFRVSNARDLASRLVEAATTPDLWESLSAGIVPPPTIAETGDRHLEIYQQLLDKKNWFIQT